MTMNRIGSLAVIAVTVAGCYNAKIETGLPPSDQKIEDHWADSWIGGLVPPSAVETAEKCPNGVAKVETKLSFLNQLVGVLTLGIYTPMYIGEASRPPTGGGTLGHQGGCGLGGL
jgi:hypothetical protein